MLASSQANSPNRILAAVRQRQLHGHGELPPGKWQIFGLAYSDIDPDIDPDAVGGDFKPFQIRVTDEWLAVVDNWRRRQRKIPSIAGAIRSLVERGLEAESQKKEPPTPELSEILEADTYLEKLYESGEISIHEYKRRALIAALSKERYSSTYTQTLKEDPDYFSRQSVSASSGYAGLTYKGYQIPSTEEVFQLEGGVMAPDDEVIPFQARSPETSPVSAQGCVV